MPRNEVELHEPLCLYAKKCNNEKCILVYSELQTLENKRLDLFIIRKDFTAIIIEMKYNSESAYKALN